MNVKDPASRLLRWMIQLEEYNYEIVYKLGAQNSNADMLSRISTITRKEGNPETMDEKLKTEILWEYHDSILGSHQGMSKTYEAIKERYSWANMKKEIGEYVKKCKKCQMN
jgi:hypothetical protein